MSVQADIVTAFQGLDRRGRGLRRTERANLDTPRELVNFHIDENDHLYMPPVGTLLHTFGVGRTVRSMQYLETPRGLIVTLDNGEIHFLEIAPGGSAFTGVTQLLATMTSPGWNLWTLGCGTYGLIGYAARGSTAAGQTWKLEPSGTSPPVTVTDISASQPISGRASWSTLFKGRRFVVERGRTVYFSDLNAYTTFGVDSFFAISGDDAGNDYLTNPGFVEGMVAWEDVLVIFLRQSVWLLTGTTPETFQLRQVQTTVGNGNAWALTRVEGGVLTYGGFHLYDRGIYLFTGSNAQKISEPVDDLMRGPDRPYATTAGRRYIFCRGEATADDVQLCIYDLDRRRWTTFDGWVQGVVASTGDGLVYANGNALYRYDAQALTPRAPGRAASVVLGYYDEGQTLGQVRYLAVKLTGRKWGTGAPTVTVTATVEDGTVTSTPVALTTDTFDGVVIPINLRGHAIELDITITPAADDNEVLIQQVQLISSRKGEKVSRA